MMLIDILRHLHEKELVHSDVRLSNILLDSKNNTAYLINFDFCAKENIPYPKEYIIMKEFMNNIKMPLSIVKEKIHDIYSLDEILDLIYCDDDHTFLKGGTS